MQTYFNTIVIGAGQAGLAMGYYLQQAKRSFVLLEGNPRLGDSWRNRYDSLVLFTPRSYSALPGMKLPGIQNAFPSKNELADYLKAYADKFDIPIKLHSPVKSVIKKDYLFHIVFESGTIYTSDNVIIATGPFRKPYYPVFASKVPDTIRQLHAADYKNRKQLVQGMTVVVGGGNSGMQIAAELSEDQEVYMSMSKRPVFLPYQFSRRSIFWWMDKLGIAKFTTDSKLGKVIQNNDPIIGLEGKNLIKSGKIKVLPRATEFKQQKLLFEDGAELEPANIIWATGYQQDYTWINIPSVFKKNSQLIHSRGITDEAGLYFLGMPWQHKRGSALLSGVGEDAEFLLTHL